ncbi:MAG: hypothetical protein ACOC6H_01505 [Thermoproteota archaeon]
MSKESALNDDSKSSWVLLAIFVTLALSVTALILAFNLYPATTSYYLLLLGFVGAAMSIYVLIQAKRKMQSINIEPPVITTVIECRKCGFKNVRDFQRGDYVFKEMEPCQKCDENRLITAIYREASEKEKKEESRF